MIKSFLSRIRQYKKNTILAPIFMALEVAAEVAIPFVMSMLIDKGVDANNMSNIALYGGILFGLSLFALTTGAMSAVSAARAAAGFSRNLRDDMFENIQKFSFANIDKFSPPSLVTRMTTDVTNVQNAFQALIRQAVRSIIMISSALIIVFNISWKLACIYLVVMPILGFVLFFIIFKVHPIFVRALKLYDRLNGVVQENLEASRVVKSFVRQDTEKEKFSEISTQIYDDFSKAHKTVALNQPAIQLAVFASMILISWIGARLIVGSGGIELTTGRMMSFFTYTMQLLMNLMLISMVFVMIIIARSSAQRITEVLNEQPQLKYPENPVFKVQDGSISFDNVGFSYVDDPNRLCLFDVNLDIKSGETIGIIGGTGSSKSSLVQLIPRLYDVTCGRLLVGGIDVKQYDLDALRNSVAVVLQKNTLFSGTIKQNLQWGDKNASDQQIQHICAISQADEFIKNLPEGYDTYIEQGGTNLSGGQKQRLCIARALLKNPKILILDDSTSAVDTKTDQLLRDAFRTHLPQTTKLIIAQRINSVMDADRIIVMESGRINACGTHSQLLQSCRIYKEIYDMQIQGGGDFDE